MQKRIFIKKVYLLTLALLAGLFLTGCLNQQTEDNQPKESQQSKQDQQSQKTGKNQNKEMSNLGKDSLTLATPNWPGGKVKSEVVKNILEEIGYDVEVKQMDPGIVYTSLSQKDIDATVAGWLPTTHKQYWDKMGDKLEIAGVNCVITWLGLGVPTYMDENIQSLEDLKKDSVKGKFGSEITGIDPGAGVMASTEKAMKEYGLNDAGWNLKSSSAAAMMASVKESYENEKPFIATVWEPHAVFNVADIRKLEDPNNIYNSPSATKEFLEEYAPSYADEEVKSDVLASVVYKGFEKDAPAAYKLFNRFQIEADTQSEWIYKLKEEDMSPSEIADEYVNNNQDQIKEWIDGLGE